METKNQNAIPEVPYHVHNGMDAPVLYQAQEPIQPPSGGSTVDTEARNAIVGIITALERLNLVKPN